jgi:hypothetical protein
VLPARMPQRGAMAYAATLPAVVAALAASLCYAVGAAVQQQQASRTATGRLVHPGLLWQIMRRPMWLAGLAVMLAGEVLHVLALAWAPLAVVQPIGVTTVLFALPVGAVLSRARPPLKELAAAAVTVAGLAALLAGVHVSTTPPVLEDADLALLVPVIGGGLVVLVGLALRSSGGAVRTVLLGCAAGATFGTTAALVRLLTARIASDGAAGLVSWATPVVVGTAVLGLLLEQAAYKSGHLGVAVAGYTVTDPLVAVAVGALVLHQSARTEHPLLSAAEALVVVAGVVLLARKAAAPTPRADAPQRRRAAKTAPTAAVVCGPPGRAPAGAAASWTRAPSPPVDQRKVTPVPSDVTLGIRSTSRHIRPITHRTAANTQR